MSKRKAVVNDIIYELDNEDLASSSDEEKSAKKNTGLHSNNEASIEVSDTSANGPTISEVVQVDSSDDALSIVLSPNATLNGGKISPDISVTDSEIKVDEDDKIEIEEDIIVDSPSTNSEINVVSGCENRKPLVKIMFQNKKVAKDYKKKIKAFMLQLIKLHEDNSFESDYETDLELDIWPEDLQLSSDNEDDEKDVIVDDNLFFVDTAPSESQSVDIPQYSQNSSLLANEEAEQPTSKAPFRRVVVCFNCDGEHQLRDCTKPRNNQKIMENRRAMNAAKVGRYHVEDDQKYGHLVPGRISGNLRYAMGLRRDEIPLYIYKMRMMGYPPGWLEDARISHSGITMFDSVGKAIQDPEDEEGEINEPGSKDKYDIKKILDYPGFNVPASSRYKEEAHRYGFPPISEQDSKMNMLQVLAPNAMKAYKRKKLTFFPSSSFNNSVEGQAEMELDDGNEILDFPSAPPLPDAPPPPLPPPPPEQTDTDIIEVDMDDEDKNKTAEPTSPSLDELEERKRMLSEALEVDIPSSPTKKEEENGDEIKISTEGPTPPNNETPIKPVNCSTPETSTPTMGRVKTTLYGTPVLNSASEFLKLPSDQKFAKDICDIINFENLPDSTGKYEKICSLLKKVKSEVDRIQDS